MTLGFYQLFPRKAEKFSWKLSYSHFMKKLFSYLKIDGYFLLFIFLMNYIVAIKSRLPARSENWELILTPEAPVIGTLGSIIIFLIIRGVASKDLFRADTFNGYSLLKTIGFTTILYLLFTNFISFVIAFAFGNIERNFTLDIILSVNFERVTDVVLFGGIYLAFTYYKEGIMTQKLLLTSEEALSEEKIQRLKAQLNPHFLFNNLNVLDQLIDEDQEAASDFLNDFADLYRRSLVHADKKLIPLEEELAFIQDYFKIMNHKYADCYTLEIVKDSSRSSSVPPYSLQMLVENAFEHNLGTSTNPVHITVRIKGEATVMNNKVAGSNKRRKSGRGLENLVNQFALLTDASIQIVDTKETYKVILPLINQSHV